MAVIYEVTLTVTADAAEDMADWLPDHAAELLALPGFLAVEIEQALEPAPAAGQREFVCRYRLGDRTALESYLAEHAERLRGEGMRRFGGRFQARRRVLTTLHRATTAPANTT